VFKRISARLSASLLVFFLLIAASFAATYVFIQKQQYDALIINVSGRQQMLVQRIARDVQFYSRATSSDQRLATRDRVLHSVRAFDTTLSALKDGGSAPLELDMSRMKEIPPVSSEASRQKLDAIDKAWGPFKTQIDAIVASEGQDTVAIDYVLANDDALLRAVQGLTDVAQTEAEAKVSTVVTLQFAALVGGLVLFLLILWATWRNIGLPLRQLVKAAEDMSTGKLDTPISTRGPTEIEELAESFERMRISIRAVMEESGGLGDDLDDL